MVRAQGRPGAVRDRHHRPEAGIRDEPARPNVSFSFTDDGREAFQEVTRQIAQRGQAQAIGPVSAEQAGQLSGHFAVVLDNEVKTRPIINFAENPDGIDGRTGAQISGGFTSVQEAQDLATVLQIGALPINLKLISQTQVSATLGSQALDAGIKAGVIGLILAILFLLFYYRFLGLIASVALGAYGVIFFALIKLIPITMTLPGIAGLVLTIGVAADSNIVIFERIKEEVRAGRSMSSAISAGYKHGISDDHRRERHHPADRLHPLRAGDRGRQRLRLHPRRRHDRLAADRGRLHPGAARQHEPLAPAALAEPRSAPAASGMRWHFDFMGASRWFFSISGVILLVGALALATKQLNFGIDFESGTRIKVALVEPTDEEGVRDTLDGGGRRRRGDPAGLRPGTRRQRLPDPDSRAAAGNGRRGRAALADEYGIAADGFDSTSVGPTFGQQVADSAPESADLLAAGDLRLRRAQVRPEVRGARC